MAKAIDRKKVQEFVIGTTLSKGMILTNLVEDQAMRKFKFTKRTAQKILNEMAEDGRIVKMKKKGSLFWVVKDQPATDQKKTNANGGKTISAVKEERAKMIASFIGKGMSAERAQKCTREILAGRLTKKMVLADWRKMNSASKKTQVNKSALGGKLKKAVTEDAAKKKEAAAAKKAKKAKKKGPGVIQTIIDLISKKGRTKKEILTELEKVFPDREPKSMMGTINCQVPKRLRKDKGLKVVENKGNKFRIIKKKA